MPAIVAFAGSPRKEPGSYTRSVLGKLMEGATSTGAESRTHDLNQPGIRGCQSCFYCRTHPECCIDDPLKPVYADIAGAKALVVATPVFFADISGQTKIWLDRMFPMVEGTAFSPRFPGKRVVTIFAQGDADRERFRPAVTRFHGLLRTFGWSVEDHIAIAGVGTPGFTLSEDIMEKAFELGKRLVQ